MVFIFVLGNLENIFRHRMWTLSAMLSVGKQYQRPRSAN